MAKRRKRKKVRGEIKSPWVLVLLSISIALVFSVVFTVLLIPVFAISNNVNIQLIFTLLLIVSGTVSSTVALIVYIILTQGR